MKPLLIVVNGVTGRMGRSRHLEGALVPLRREGIRVADGRRDVELILVGRRGDALSQIARDHDISRWSTDLHTALSDPAVDVYFDAQRSALRPAAVGTAIEAGKHVYCEKPLAPDHATALGLAVAADKAGVRTGVVQDKLFTPGFRALEQVLATGRLGRVFDVRGKFGYWVAPDARLMPTRPSWNYRRADGGDLIADLFSHWYYLLEMVSEPLSVASLAATHVRHRHDELGRPYDADVDDLAHVLVRMKDKVTGVITASWIQRPPTPFTLTVHGSEASAVATPESCAVSGARAIGVDDGRCAALEPLSLPLLEDEFLGQWRAFLEHLTLGADYRWNFWFAARSASFCDAVRAAAESKAWCDVPYFEGATC